ncbi:choice-of-anchor A domain-containing protein [Frondihabitans australicus]|uniref:Choice-of-anchor A domain-containing protein n=1 Tax=Frondihabitans australicus TaxID=386892 RepID=A0A495IGX3_9MICO|nr:choice-of-anchor A domain-containing protein [Frondihabitans australicus]
MIAAAAAVLFATGALTLQGGLGVPAPASAAPAAPTAAPDLPECPTPQQLAQRETPIGTDANVSVFVGGDYSVGANAAESEGVLAVGGTATFDKTNGGTFNVGVVGFGSGVVPPAGSDMLLTGGDATPGATTTVDVGHGIGGNVVAGGTAAPLDRFETSGGTVTSDAADPLGPFATFGTTIRTKSTQYAALPTTGTTSERFNTLTFTGDGSSATQVFRIPGDELGTQSEPRAVEFVRIPTDARIIITVTGSTAAVYPAGFFTDASTEQISFGDPRFVELATHTMWNFADAADVTIGTGDQLLGSVMVPSATATTRITASTNGRLLIGGDLVFDGQGNEAHSFPFPDDDFECKPTIDPPVATGGLAVRKVVSDADGVADPAQEFVGTWSCTEAPGTEEPGGTWRVTASGAATTIAENLPVGSVCRVAEGPPDGPVADDPSYGWAPPTITPSTVTIGDGTVSEVTVTNTVTRSTGGFDIVKALDDPTGRVDPGRTYSGGWSCAVGDATVASGTWSLTAGGAPHTVSGVPTGAVCSVTEDEPTAPVPGDPSAVWEPPVISPDTITVGDGTTPTVTVTNRVEEVTGSFAVTKSVSRPSDGVVPGTRFTFDWRCTAPGGATLSGSVEVAAGGVETVAGVAVGSSCTLTETGTPPVADDSYEWLDPVWSVDGGAETTGREATFTIPAAGSRLVTVAWRDEIVRHVGTLDVLKSLDDPDHVVAPTQTYHVIWSCVLPGGGDESGADDILADGIGHDLATDLPFGTRCNVSEDLQISASPSSDGDRAFRWAAPVLGDSEVVIGEGGSTVSIVHIDNTVADVTTSATIAKVVDAPSGGAPSGAVYRGSVRCIAPDGSVRTATWAVSAGRPAAPLIDGLVDGTACTVTEATPPAADGFEWQQPVVSPDSFVAHAGSTVSVTVRNTLVADPESPGGGTVSPSDTAGSQELAATGSTPAPAALIAALLLAAGASLVETSRRRRPRR